MIAPMLHQIFCRFGFVAVASACVLSSVSGVAQEAVGTPQTRQTMKVRPGPWGELEYHYTFLQAPDSLIELTNVPSWQTVWRFPEMDKAAVVALLKGCELNPELEAELAGGLQWLENDDETRLHPSMEFVSAMHSEDRRKIYRELRRWKENPYHWAPVVIEAGTVRDWFADSGLGENMIEAIENLAYPLGDSLAFSDVPMLIARSASDKEDRLIMKSMTRTRTLIMRLSINSETDLDTLRDYWSAGFTRTDVLPLIDSLARLGDDESLDLSHLLPPTPRKHLYTFPSISMGVSGAFPESFWTATNFFNFQPGEPGVGSEKFFQIMEKRYTALPGAEDYRYGDVLLLQPGEGDGSMQACVYIADDIVFTKTGRQMSRPWVLKHLDVLKARFRGESDLPVEVKAWRKRDVTGS